MSPTEKWLQYVNPFHIPKYMPRHSISISGTAPTVRAEVCPDVASRRFAEVLVVGLGRLAEEWLCTFECRTDNPPRPLSDEKFSHRKKVSKLRIQRHEVCEGEVYCIPRKSGENLMSTQQTTSSLEKVPLSPYHSAPSGSKHRNERLFAKANFSSPQSTSFKSYTLCWVGSRDMDLTPGPMPQTCILTGKSLHP